MDLKVQPQNTTSWTFIVPDFCASVPSRVYKLLGVFCLLVITARLAVHSAKPGGILHGARILYLNYTRPRFDSKSWPHGMTSKHDNTCDLHHPDEEPLPAIRTEFGARGTIVYGWPSTGGVWVHENCYGIELDFLGVSRFDPSATERFSKEEDEFCKRLERIGARFYESEFAYNRFSRLYRDSHSWYGWPGAVPDAGVWALWTRGADDAELGVSRIRNALTMEERCKAIEMLGGKFYKKWEDAAAAAAAAAADTSYDDY